ncbi:translation initiation factor IF-2-like isoform X2 [Schistocerca gregaria]|uniref:translation initiation factor IF-2-like isoform X2 n=1 Tax=Schistocerca gregaria TaxID=7010 RepID=UPI00211DCACF|nr:translation initiation factor IF-2-like isoform X2 [Schistocerca gregaria]
MPPKKPPQEPGAKGSKKAPATGPAPLAAPDDSSPSPSPPPSPSADDDDSSQSSSSYNTITSLAALKELLHGPGSGPTNDVDLAWFEHYFLSHVNRLPKHELRSPCLRPILEGRRVSEWAGDAHANEAPPHADEAVEDEEADEVADLCSSTATYPGAGGPLTSSGRPHVATIFQQPPPAAAGAAARARWQQRGSPGSSVRPSPLASPHLDKRFVDTSLVEMRSEFSSSSTIDSDTDVWVMRDESVASASSRRRPVSVTALPY